MTSLKNDVITSISSSQTDDTTTIIIKTKGNDKMETSFSSNKGPELYAYGTISFVGSLETEYPNKHIGGSLSTDFSIDWLGRSDDNKDGWYKISPPRDMSVNDFIYIPTRTRGDIAVYLDKSKSNVHVVGYKLYSEDAAEFGSPNQNVRTTFELAIFKVK